MKKSGKWPWKNRVTSGERERIDLEKGLLQTGRALQHAYAGFNNASDPELVESFVYEIRALQSRYSYLLRCRKALEVSCAPTSEKALPAL